MLTDGYTIQKSADELVTDLLRLAEAINAAITYQEVLEAVAPVLPDCQGVYLNLWQHLDYHKAEYLEIVAAASISDHLGQRIGQRFMKVDFPFAVETYRERLMVIENVQADPRIDATTRSSYAQLGTQAYVRVVFQREGRIIGALFFKYTQPRQFAERERSLALGIADLVLAAVERIQSQQETAAAVEAQRVALVAEQEAREELGLLYKASEAVQAANTFQEVIEAIAPLVYPIEKVNLILWEYLDYRRATYFEVRAGVHRLGGLSRNVGVHFDVKHFPIAEHMANLVQLTIEDVNTHPLVDPVTRAGWKEHEIQALLMTRLARDDRWYGVLSFENSFPRPFSEREQRRTLAISELVLGAVIRIHTQQELATAVQAQRIAFLAEQEARQEMGRLYQVSKAINQAADMAQVLEATKQLFPDPIDVAIFAWEHYDRSRAGYLECIVSTDPALSSGTRLPRELVAGLIDLNPTELFVANDVNSPEWAGHPAVESARYFGLHSIAFTSLIHAQQIQGGFSIASYQSYVFSPQEIRLVMAIADLTAAALQRFRSRRAEQEALQEREELFRASQAINAANSFEEILASMRHIDFDDGDQYLFIFENFDYHTASYIETVATTGERFMRPGLRIPINQLPFLKTHPRSGLSVYENIPEHPELDEVTKATMQGHGTLSNLRFGLVWHGRLLGSFGVDHATPKRYTEREKRLMTALGELVSAAVERIRLQQEMQLARKRAERLAEQAQQLAALEERTHLARELHDSVSQALYGIGLGAQTAKRCLESDARLARESVDYILTLAQAGLAEMRALIFELRPESLEAEGLVIALAKQGASLQARHEINVQLDLGAEPVLSLPRKESLYRVLREALHNVIKHAQASQVILRMAETDSGLKCEIIDNGVGFNVNQDYPGHLGLQSMRERIQQLGGQISIESGPEQGTHLTVALPH